MLLPPDRNGGGAPHEVNVNVEFEGSVCVCVCVCVCLGRGVGEEVWDLCHPPPLPPQFQLVSKSMLSYCLSQRVSVSNKILIYLL